MEKELKLEEIDFSKSYDDEAQVVEKDLRKPVKDTSLHPYNGIGRIICKIYDPEAKEYIEKSGTASIIAKKLILTATHVLKLKNCKALSDDIQFFPQQLLRENQISRKGIKVKMIHIRSDFIDSEDQINKKLDFTLLQLQDNNIITQNQILPLDFNYKHKKQDQFKISGYGGNGVFANLQTYEDNVAVGQKDDFLLYKHSTNGGNSGGPVLLKKQENQYIVIGIHKGSISLYNYCILLRFINQPITNSTPIKSIPLFSSKDVQQKWPETSIKSFRQKDKKFQQLKQKIRQLEQKLKKSEDDLMQKDKKISQLNKKIQELQQNLTKSQNILNEKDFGITRLEQNIAKFQQEGWSNKLLKQTSIIDKQGLQFLVRWLIKPIFSIQLKFKASNNDFSLKKYYEKCGYLQDTIIIAKTTKGKIIGAYTPLSFNFKGGWFSGNHTYVKDESKTSFVFSLSLQQKFQLINDHAIIRYQNKNSINFFDTFKIGDKSNAYSPFSEQNKFWLGASFLFGNSYNVSKYRENKQSYLKIIGQQNERFLTEQWQVYQVLFK